MAEPPRSTPTSSGAPPQAGPAGVDVLSEALLPVLIHRLNNATQLLSGLRSLLSLEPDGSLVANRWGDLSDAATEAHRLSWALAVLSSANGSALCLERRESDGLEILVELVREVLRRARKDLPEVGTLPSIAADAPPGGAGWELPWALASMLYLFASEAGDDFGFAFTQTATGSELRMQCARDLAPAGLDAILARLPSLVLTRTDDGVLLTLPAGWLVARDGGGAAP